MKGCDSSCITGKYQRNSPDVSFLHSPIPCFPLTQVSLPPPDTVPFSTFAYNSPVFQCPLPGPALPACPAVVRDTLPTPCLLPKAAVRGQDTLVTGVTGWEWPASSPASLGSHVGRSFAHCEGTWVITSCWNQKVSAENMQIPAFLGFDHVCRGTAKTSHKMGTSPPFPSHCKL